MKSFAETVKEDLVIPGRSQELTSHLRGIVQVMRELGIVQYNGIVLDPYWRPQPAKGKPRTRQEQAGIDRMWANYRTAVESAEIDGTMIPESPIYPEIDPNG